ncbi:MAG: hypothetical protein ACI965_000984 [Paraglaciecola sp.]|jgi:hypothetical protein
MKKRLIVLISSISALLSSQTFAKADVEVTWQEPGNYWDVRPTSGSRSRFRESTFKKLDEYIAQLAEDLPDGQTLLMTVDNLDLAGQVWPASFVGLGNSGAEVRLIKAMDIPRMSFTYKLLDESGQVVQESAVKLKDMSFLSRSNRFFDSETLRYEKNMIHDWFKDEFSRLMEKK